MRPPWHPHQLADLTDQSLAAITSRLATAIAHARQTRDHHGAQWAWTWRTWALAERERRVAAMTDWTGTDLLTVQRNVA